MSLINKMLQDLDARGSQDGAVPQSGLRPAHHHRSSRPVWTYAVLGLLLVVVLGLVGLVAWPLLQSRAVAVPPVPVKANTVTFAKPVVQSLREVEPAPLPESAAEPVSVPADAPVALASSREPVRPVKSSLPVPPRLDPVRPAPANAAAYGGRDMTAAQRAENEYRRGLDDLQEGRTAEAFKRLEQTLSFDPRHQGARETLIRLLLENKRQEEAVQQMVLGLELDARQPALAMMLARLQVEQGGPALDTLMRTLPSALGNADYQAFLAAVLQRAQRHRDAIEHYQQAVEIAAQNGVWWMGLGISLQAEQRLPEAREAFERARVSASLAPELQVFVERKLQQLGHR